MIECEWDPRKATSNHRKHGVQFADAVTVLEDDRGITVPEDHVDEQRWITLGANAAGQVMVVAYTWRGNVARMISARPATPNETRQYVESL